MNFEIKNESDIACSGDEIIEELIDYEKEITAFETAISDLNEEGDDVEDVDDVEEGDDLEDADDIDDGDDEKEHYIWSYFNESESETTECKLCKVSVEKQINHLLKHLKDSHSINKNIRLTSEPTGRGRPSRSFIWKYCSRQNQKQAFCHICNKLLFFGGGNTSNIAKHLRRRHSDLLETNELGSEKTEENPNSDEGSKANALDVNSVERKDKKVGSYVWNYCEKVDKRNVKCNLCNKVMSYHGTANVITHLARVHRINGNNEKENNCTEEEPFEIVTIDNNDSLAPSRKGRGASNPCNVWKYCKRLTKDIVRCGICKKKFSFQGTSNLQRHLQRMHDIEPLLRPIIPSEAYEKDNDEEKEIFWQFCEKFGDDQAKCNICNFGCSVEDIRKHMIQIHAIGIQLSEINKIKVPIKKDEESSEENDSENEILKNTIETKTNETVIDDMEIAFEEDESLLDDMIEIDPDNENNEDIFNPMEKSQRISPDSLSSKSSDHGKSSPVLDDNEESQRLKELRDELMLSETEYFREKAAYYRMQKYLAALQAKKARLELENFSENSSNSGVDAHYVINSSISGR